MKLSTKKQLSFAGSKRINRIAMYLFIAYIAFAAVAGIWSVYIEELLGNDAYVGFTISFFTIVSFLSFFLIIPIIEKNDKLKLTFFAYFFIAISYFVFYFNDSFWIFFVVASVSTVLTTIRISSTGIVIEKNSSRKNLARNEGFMYTIYNLSFFIGPLLGFLIAAVMGMKYVFFISALFLLISLLILRSAKVNHGGKKRRVDVNPIKNFFDFFRSKDRTLAYVLGSGVNFWWSLIYVYVPLLIIKYLDGYWVGIFLAAVVVPLFLFEYPFSKKAGELGYKKFFFRGYILASLIALACFVIFDIWFIIPALIIASVGLAMLESTTESYFFDVLKGDEDQRFYPPYNTAINTGAFVGQVIPALILLFLDLRYVFLVFFVGCLLLALLSLRTKNIIEKRRK